MLFLIIIRCLLPKHQEYIWNSGRVFGNRQDLTHSGYPSCKLKVNSATSIKLGKGFHGNTSGTWEERKAFMCYSPQNNLVLRLESHLDSSETKHCRHQLNKSRQIATLWDTRHSFLILAKVVGTKLILSAQQLSQTSNLNNCWVTKTASYFHFSYWNMSNTKQCKNMWERFLEKSPLARPKLNNQPFPLIEGNSVSDRKRSKTVCWSTRAWLRAQLWKEKQNPIWYSHISFLIKIWNLL